MEELKRRKEEQQRWYELPMNWEDPPLVLR